MTARSTKLINFAAGPAAIPLPVRQQVSEAVLDYNNSGLSIMEIGHRSSLFNDILEESKSLVKELCRITDDYEILWMQGGGRLQFSLIPMNFLPQDGTAGYIDSGYWAKDAMEHASYYGKAVSVASSRDQQYRKLPVWPEQLPEGLSYVHITTNNTIAGTQLNALPAMDKSVPLIADMSSDIFSCTRNYNRYAMFYAVAQKNIGMAGNTLVVVRKDLLSSVKRTLPPILNYAEHAKANSVLNTAPVTGIYVSLLMLRWIKEQGIEALERENERKAALLYTEIERNSLFYCPIDENDRSKMNIVFDAFDQENVKGLIDFCAQHDITGIDGHRKAGGFRASLYNATGMGDVTHLVSVMQAYEQLVVINNKQNILNNG